MKKFTAMILSLILVLSLSVPAMAATVTETGTQTADVKGKYVDNTTTPTVYSVDITWGAMEFSYTHEGIKTWDPSTHTYTDETFFDWFRSENSADITVVNHSNVGVNVAYTFEALEDYSTITGKFSRSSSGTLGGTWKYSTSCNLGAGEVGAPDSASSVLVRLELYGALDTAITEYTKIGTVTLTIS